MEERAQGGGSLTAAGGTRRKAGQIYVVMAEWQNGEPEILAAFIGKSAEKRAKRYAEETRHEYAEGKYTARKYSVWAHEGNEDPDWDVDVHVEVVETNPRIPRAYRRLRQRRKAVQVS